MKPHEVYFYEFERLARNVPMGRLRKESPLEEKEELVAAINSAADALWQHLVYELGWDHECDIDAVVKRFNGTAWRWLVRGSGDWGALRSALHNDWTDMGLRGPDLDS